MYYNSDYMINICIIIIIDALWCFQVPCVKLSLSGACGAFQNVLWLRVYGGI